MRLFLTHSVLTGQLCIKNFFPGWFLKLCTCGDKFAWFVRYYMQQFSPVKPSPPWFGWGKSKKKTKKRRRKKIY